MSDIVERLRANYSINDSSGEAHMALEAADEIERLRAEITEWRECAKYDALMSGPVAMGWDRSALERCRKKYIDPQKGP